MATRLERGRARSVWLVSVAGGALAVLLGAGVARERYLDRVEKRDLAAEMTGGNPGAGLDKMQGYGCTACHTIPGAPGWVTEMARDRARIGPPLDAYGRRLYIAGVVPNTPENLVRWIRFPTSVDPRTAMPDLHLSDQDARDMAAYLYTME